MVDVARQGLAFGGSRQKGDLHTDRQVLNLGPSHPATHGTVKIITELEGETIMAMDVP